MSRLIRTEIVENDFFPLVVETVAEEKIMEDMASYEEAVLEPEDSAAKERAEEVILAGKKKAEEMLAEAKRQEQAILDKAKQQVQERLEQAAEEGHREGLEKGLEEGHARMHAETQERIRQIQAQAKKTLDQAEYIRAHLISGAEEEVVDLAMTIASAVIRNHAEINRDIVVKLAGEALERAVSSGYYSIFVSPDDVELLQEFIAELRRSASGGTRIHIIPDSSISHGGCKVETENGMVDMTLESQLEQIRKALRDELENSVNRMEVEDESA